jgi:hypothetical protein
VTFWRIVAENFFYCFPDPRAGAYHPVLKVVPAISDFFLIRRCGIRRPIRIVDSIPNKARLRLGYESLFASDGYLLKSCKISMDRSFHYRLSQIAFSNADLQLKIIYQLAD